MSDEKAKLKLSERLRDRQHFTEIPNEIFYRCDISRQAKWLWICLCTFAWNTDEVWPSMETLEKLTGFSSRTVRKYKDELIDKGLLDQKRRGLGQTNLYRLNCPDKMENTPERKLLPFNPLNTSDQPPENFRSTPEKFPTNKDNGSKDKDEEGKGEDNTHPREEITNLVNHWLDCLTDEFPDRQRYEKGHHIYEEYCVAVEDALTGGPQHGQPFDTEELAELITWTFDDEFWHSNLKEPRQLLRNGQKIREAMKGKQPDDDHCAKQNGSDICKCSNPKPIYVDGELQMMVDEHNNHDFVRR